MLSFESDAFLNVGKRKRSSVHDDYSERCGSVYTVRVVGLDIPETSVDDYETSFATKIFFRDNPFLYVALPWEFCVTHL